MNKNTNPTRELTYNEAKLILSQMNKTNLNEFGQENLQNQKASVNVEFGEMAKKNNSNNEHSAHVKTAARKDDNVKKVD